MHYDFEIFTRCNVSAQSGFPTKFLSIKVPVKKCLSVLQMLVIFLTPTHIVPCHKIPHLSYDVTINLDRLCRSIEGKEPAE